MALEEVGPVGALKDEDFEQTEVWTMKNEKQHLQSGKYRKETSGILFRGLGDSCEKESGWVQEHQDGHKGLTGVMCLIYITS